MKGSRARERGGQRAAPHAGGDQAAEEVGEEGEGGDVPGPGGQEEPHQDARPAGEVAGQGEGLQAASRRNC